MRRRLLARSAVIAGPLLARIRTERSETWEPVAPGDPDHLDYARRLLHAVADRARWQAALAEARRKAETKEEDSTGDRRAA